MLFSTQGTAITTIHHNLFTKLLAFYAYFMILLSLNLSEFYHFFSSSENRNMYM